jgi:hypothetical protein
VCENVDDNDDNDDDIDEDEVYLDTDEEEQFD